MIVGNFLTIPCFLLLFLVDGFQAESQLIRGVWEVQQMTINGKEIPIDQSPKKVLYIFVGNKFVRSYGDLIEDIIVFKIDSSERVHKIDFHMNDGTFCKGIFQISGSKLSICWSFDKRERPTTFQAAEKSGRISVVAKRFPSPNQR